MVLKREWNSKTDEKGWKFLLKLWKCRPILEVKSRRVGGWQHIPGYLFEVEKGVRQLFTLPI